MKKTFMWTSPNDIYLYGYHLIVDETAVSPKHKNKLIREDDSLILYGKLEKNNTSYIFVKELNVTRRGVFFPTNEKMTVYIKHNGEPPKKYNISNIINKLIEEEILI